MSGCTFVAEYNGAAMAMPMPEAVEEPVYPYPALVLPAKRAGRR